MQSIIELNAEKSKKIADYVRTSPRGGWLTGPDGRALSITFSARSRSGFPPTLDILLEAAPMDRLPISYRVIVNMNNPGIPESVSLWPKGDTSSLLSVAAAGDPSPRILFYHVFTNYVVSAISNEIRPKQA